MNQNISAPDDLPDPQETGSPGGDRTDPKNPDTESKSQRKRNAHLITQLAGQLVEMKPKALAALPLEPNVLEAVTHCAEIKAHGARKRQLHFVSKLLRESGNAQELQTLMLRPDLPKRTAKTTNPHVEFRNQLLDNFSSHVEALRENYPSADLQQVRQLVRNAHNESKKALNKPDQAIVHENKAKENTTSDNKNREASATTVSPQSTKSAKSLLKLLSASHNQQLPD